MGVAATIGATLVGGWLSGRQQQKQYNAAAQQYENNAQIAYNNAARLQEQGEEQSKSNAINEDNKRRKLLQLAGQQRANVGAAGITASGSALDALSDSAYNAEMELAVDRYNGLQQVDKFFQSSTDNVNQGDVYKQNAKDYRKAGKRAFMNSMLMSGLSLAANLYSPKSVGAQEAKGTLGTSTGAQSYGKGTDGKYGWGNGGNVAAKDYKNKDYKPVYGSQTDYKFTW